MGKRHEDVSERLPEYIKAGKIPEEIKAHIESCAECREEFSLLRQLSDAWAAEDPTAPGGMFFETLPGKVRASLKAKKEKRIEVFRLVPLFALMLIAVLAGYLRLLEVRDEVYSFGVNDPDPLTYSALDLSGLREADIPQIADIPEGAYPQAEDLFEHSFQRELAYMNRGEMAGLFEALKKETGGV